MTNEQILKKCIEKAVEGGWLYFKGIKKQEMMKVIYGRQGLKNKNNILFDHSFAKAFWGEGYDACPDCHSADIYKTVNETRCNLCDRGVIPIKIEGWKDYIIGLVLSEDRLKYMEQFIK